MGYDFVGCEINTTYYELQEERFRRECLGEVKTNNSQTLVQGSLF